jgi:calcium-dependent protein kinase
MGLNLIICKSWVLLAVIDKPWITYGQRKLYWEPWSYMGFFSLPVLQKTWPETFELGSQNCHKDIKSILKAVSRDRLDPSSSTESTRDEPKFNLANMVGDNVGDVRQEYVFLSPPLGKGAFGEVRKAKHNKSGLIRAVKIINKGDLNYHELSVIKDEVAILKSLDHPNILRVLEYFEDSERIYIITELCTGGELFDKIIELEQFSEKQAKEVMVQVLNAISYCHSKGVVHRDLKPENILYETKKASSSIKVVDFGLSTFYKRDQELTGATGTPYYMAPEVFTGTYTETCDVWSLGVILYILLTGEPPFNGATDYHILVEIKKGTYNLDFPSLSEHAKDLIRKMLDFDKNSRISAQDCLDHPWFLDEEAPSEFDHEKLQNLNNFSKRSKLQKMVWYYLANNLTTNEEREKLAKVFKALDKDKNGMLSKDEISKAYTHLKGFTNQAIEEVIRTFDTDRSGMIDYSEYLAAAFDRQKLLTKQRVEQCFKLFDKDGNGSVDAQELKLALSGSAKDAEIDQYIKQLIADVDKNKDGKIQLFEFTAMLYALGK